MKRRLFFGVISLSVVSFGVWKLIDINRGNDNSLSYERLPSNIKALRQNRFEVALSDLSVNDLVEILKRNKVLVGNEFSIKQLYANRLTDSIVLFQRAQYTESELALYVLVSRLHAQRMWRLFN